MSGWLPDSHESKEEEARRILNMPVKACVRSGYCCKKSLCAFGEYRDDGKLPCKHLGGEKSGEHYCKKFDEISKKPGAKSNPAFGAGCCSSLNSDRRDHIRKRGNVEVYVYPTRLS